MENMTILCNKFCPDELSAMRRPSVPFGLPGVEGISLDDNEQEEEEEEEEEPQ